MPASELTRATIASFALLVASTQLAGCVGPRSSFRGPDMEDAIRTTLSVQQKAWNDGNLEFFMTSGYWNSPELTFFSGGEVTRGFVEMLERYEKNYGGAGKERGTLAFTAVEIVPIADDAALVRGRWDLDFAEKKDVGGLFTLVFRETSEDSWKIVHDHTSVDG